MPLYSTEDYTMELNEKLLARVEKNAVFTRYAELGVREGLFSDMASALGRLQKTVVSCTVD